MNKIYRLIKNRNTGVVQVAPETARAHGKGKGIVKAGALAAVLACTSPMAWAAETYWDAGTSDWFTSTNWSTNAVPTDFDFDFAYINNGGTAQVQSAGAVAEYLGIGYSGTGNLEISNSGTLSISTRSSLGYQAGSSGTVIVDGAGSTWSNGYGVSVGYGGTGTLTIRNGGSASLNLSFLIGELTSGTGTATVTGSGSSLTAGSSIYVGVSGTGTLTLSSGGVVSNTNGFLGHYPGGSGTVTVDGAGSSWSNSGNLTIGRYGSGTLTLSNGGVVSNTHGILGDIAGSSGTATVDGTGSSWNNSGNLTVGNAGTGELTLSSGGAVSNTDGVLGNSAGSSGTVTVDGIGSSWSNSGNLTVGNAGTGALTLSSGGVVSNTNGVLGNSAGSSGTVTVDGIGSSWNNSGNLTVGNADTGSLTLSNGGTLSNSIGWIGRLPGGAGTVVVDGGGSVWTNTSLLSVGVEGTGSLTLSNGGTVSSSDNLFGGVIGYYPGSTGTVTVEGSGSSWTETYDVNVGYNGSGTLNIADGGTVNVGSGTLRLAAAGSASGTLNIGTGGAAGVLNATTVSRGSGSGTATLNFNHTDGDYYFTNNGTSGGTVINITGSTAVNQIGSGTTYLTGTNTYSGATTVSGGTLSVNGSLTNSAVTVNSGGTLGGSGSIGGAVTVNSGGTLAPGNSPGLLSVDSLTLDVGSTTVMEIDGTTRGTQYDAINVTGTATLDGTLSLVFGYTPTVGDSYTLIDAAAINGDFSTIATSGLGAALKVVPTLTDNYVMTVNFAQESFITAAGGTGALTSNQDSVATNLDTFSTSGQAADLIAALNALSAGALPSAYDSLSGAQHNHTLPQAMRASRQFTQVIGERLGWGGSNTNTADASRLGIVQLAYNGDDMAGLLAAPKPSEAFWLRALGGVGDIDTDGNALSADYDNSGVALGYDREVGDGLLAGVAFGYTRSDVDMHAGGSDIDSYQLAAYSRKQWGNHYLNTTFDIGHHLVDSTRQVQFSGFSGVAQADYRIDDAGLSLEAGRHYSLSDKHRVTPFAGLEYGHYRQSGFSESGAGDANLTYDDDTMDSLRSVVGARVNSVLRSAGGMRFDTTAGLAWVHEHLDSEASPNPAFAVNGNVPFTVDGPATDPDRAQASLGVSAQLSKRTQLDLAYRGEFADSDRQHAVSATLRMKW